MRSDTANRPSKTFLLTLSISGGAQRRPLMLLLGGILGDPMPDQCAHKAGGQGPVRVKTNGALARLVALEFVLVSFRRRPAPWVECAVIGRCAEEREHLSFETEGRELLADALLPPLEPQPE